MQKVSNLKHVCRKPGIFLKHKLVGFIGIWVFLVFRLNQLEPYQNGAS